MVFRLEAEKDRWFGGTEKGEKEGEGRRRKGEKERRKKGMQKGERTGEEKDRKQGRNMIN